MKSRVSLLKTLLASLSVASLFSLNSVTASSQTVSARPIQTPPQKTKSKTSTIVDSLKPVDIGLVVVAKEAVKRVLPNVGRFDFGEASLIDRLWIDQTFVLRNVSRNEIKLGQVQTSCGCTTAVLQADGTSNKKADTITNARLPSIAPGKEVRLKVHLELASLASGLLHKYVSLYVTGHEKPVLLLEMTGTILPAVSFSPAFVDFGRVQANGTVTQTLSVTFDARLREDAQKSILVSSNPDILVQRLEPDAAETNTAHPKTGISPKKTVVQTFHVTLSNHAAIGSVSATLTFASPGRQSKNVTHTPLHDVASLALSRVSAPVIGLVQGDLTAQPQAIAFGSVMQGQEITRQVLLTGTKSALQNLSLASANRWVSARLKPQEGASGAQMLDVTISPNAPVGLLQTQLKISLMNGQRLLLPISVVVQPTPTASKANSATSSK